MLVRLLILPADSSPVTKLGRQHGLDGRVQAPE